MSKQFRDKKCVYCVDNFSTSVGDHIFARQFFPEELRNNLPKVPACKQCNDQKSQLEHYATTVFPFGAQHQHALPNLEKVKDRLAKNQKLHRELKSGASTIISPENSLPIMTILIDTQKVMDLFKYITKGLIWHHWEVYILSESDVGVRLITKETEEHYDSWFLNVPSVTNNLGDGTFMYEGKRGSDNKYSCWKFQFLGGANLTNDQTTFTSLVAITAPSNFLKKAVAMGFY